MKKYKVKVNGKVYEVELEAVEESQGHVVNDAAQQPAPAVNNAAPAEGATINAPISGKVLDVKVSVGQKVNKGDVVCIIEAMKLENEVLASVSGTVKEIKVSKGAMVSNKQVLIVIG